jgi:hypothetical protein
MSFIDHLLLADASIRQLLARARFCLLAFVPTVDFLEVGVEHNQDAVPIRRPVGNVDGLRKLRVLSREVREVDCPIRWISCWHPDVYTRLEGLRCEPRYQIQCGNLIGVNCGVIKIRACVCRMYGKLVSSRGDIRMAQYVERRRRRVKRVIVPGRTRGGDPQDIVVTEVWSGLFGVWATRVESTGATSRRIR